MSVEDSGTEPLVIPDKRYFTISEASELCRVPQSKLRYWEERFSDILKVQRRNNRRYFTRENLITVREINTLIEERGLTAEGVADYYQNRVNTHTENVDEYETSSVANDSHADVEPAEPSEFENEVNHIIRDLRNIREALRSVTG